MFLILLQSGFFLARSCFELGFYSALQSLQVWRSKQQVRVSQPKG